MPRVLNGQVSAGDIVAYSSRKYWDMYVRIGVVVRARRKGLLIRVIKSSDGCDISRLVWVTELKRVVKVNGKGVLGRESLSVARSSVAP